MEILFQGKKIHFTESGKGSTVVLLHGFTESLEIWKDFEPELSKKYRVICIDLPGHGLSDCISDEHSMELMADAVKQVLIVQQVESCVMIGHSMGGYVSLAFAEKNPHVLKGLGLFHSSALADSDVQKENRQRAIEIIKESHLGFLMNFIPDLFAKENKEKFKTQIEELVEKAKTMSVQGVVAAQRGMLIRTDKQSVLSSLNIPILMIAGGNDSRIPYEKILMQLELPKVCYSLLLKDCGHMGYIEEKSHTLHAVGSFIEKCYNF